MKNVPSTPLLTGLICLLSLFSVYPDLHAQTKIRLWPGFSMEPDKVIADSSGYNRRITEVTDPVIEVFEPQGGNTSGLGIVVCPGGGYNILAIEHEGYEIASWLNSLGISAFVLHYRVPGKPEEALKDAARAIRIVRDRYGNRHPFLSKIGIMGFSAGGSLSARLSTRYRDSLYEPIDEADNFSARPDFTLLIYPAYLDRGTGRTLTPELTIDKETPPMFIFETADDPYGNSALVMAGALRDKKVPVELHFLPVGGHGYGVRPGNPAADRWPDLAAHWLNGLRMDPDPALPFRNSRFAEVQGIRLHYRTWRASTLSDNAPKILLVHGMGGSTWSWEDNAPALARAGFEVVAVDVPPFGFSDRNPDLSQSQESRSAYLWALLDSVYPGSRWNLMGHSMGGGIVQAMAIQKPDRIDKVIFADPALFMTTGSQAPANLSLLRFRPFEWIAATAGKAILIRPKKVRELLVSAFGTEPSPEDVAEYYRALSQPGTARALIRANTHPAEKGQMNGLDFRSTALAIWGENDTWVPLARQKVILDQLPTIRVQIIPGAGHCPMETHIDEFNRLSIHFLKEKPNN